MTEITAEKRMNVESFNLDHTKVKAPYVRLACVTDGDHGDIIYKYDLRVCQPNQDHSPMGCQTGFYVTLLNMSEYQDALDLIEATLKDVIVAKEVPACNVVQCGWAASHSLEGAQKIAQYLLDKRSEWTEIFA